jgi:uncharacterized membrane protein|tara:strand:- start:515 stop:838 length:324 start_codon:yes stop_codon:yes gene_type:complete
MISLGYLIVVGLFLLYYLLVLIFEKRMIHDPKEIIGKFLSVILFYAGVSIIYFSLTGEPLYGDSIENYSIYIFLIGFVAFIWAVPDLLSEFKFFRKFMDDGKKKRRK